MKRILLTQGQYALVDDWNYDYLIQWKWQAVWKKNIESYYAIRSIPDRHISMASIIAKTPKGMIADHKNHDTLDNQEHNLRNVTRSQNDMNRKLRSDNKLGEKCICIDRGMYLVKVRREKKVVYQKIFKTIEEAIQARNWAIKECHGEFAYLP